MSTPIRVLHCIQNLNYGGMERVLSDLVHGVDPARFEPHVLTLQYVGRYGRGLERVAQLHEGPTQGRLSLIRPVALARAIRSIAPDVVHLHSGIWFKCARASRMAGVEIVVYTEHGRMGTEGRLAQTLDGLAARYTDHVVAVSEATADQLVVGPGVLRQRIEVIPNGIDTTRFAPGPSAFRAEHGLSDEVVLIGSVGRLEPVKGYTTLLAGLRHMLDTHEVGTPVHLVLAGDGSERARLESLRTELALEPYVTLLGWCDDPEGLLRALDIFVLTSLSEGTSISLLEALSSGCCPVVTRVGGNPDVLGATLAHRLVESQDVRSIGDGLARACFDGPARAEDGRRGRRRVQDAFDVRTMVAAYERLYGGG